MSVIRTSKSVASRQNIYFRTKEKGVIMSFKCNRCFEKNLECRVLPNAIRCDECIRSISNSDCNVYGYTYDLHTIEALEEFEAEEERLEKERLENECVEREREQAVTGSLGPIAASSNVLDNFDPSSFLSPSDPFSFQNSSGPFWRDPDSVGEMPPTSQGS
ncbi:hypothetical protein SS1G_00285 [Sclerotinia sclerotiorum 1980 UF-70]|uniref:Uncharacterized protein n=1 Tax=Sclerotinia sclerotiorum (strain ATCC 18683 / 1980 / Ss-1) TaxID=665079 RepID=A7E4R3_SCLS1|nr:hypothetical protein SS1G_00285 [Sclerotinia sclerotiorum 1980 UF-70]EDN90885.1 hypothetical protein SS1G_00285 [Sclerotinia sclerotiorum 1980 UF-70]